MGLIELLCLLGNVCQHHGSGKGSFQNSINKGFLLQPAKLTLCPALSLAIVLKENTTFYRHIPLYSTIVMAAKILGLTCLALTVLASPVPEIVPPISFPGGLIPSIPGVTTPLSENAPPLPILQLPTPALESPPFTGSNIRPKKIGYFFTAAGDNVHKGMKDISHLCRNSEKVN